MPTGACWRSVHEPAPFRPQYEERSTIATAGAASRAAMFASVRATTSVTGPMEAPPGSRISPCSVAATIARFTKRATRSIDSPMASFVSAGLTANSSPEVLRPPEVRGDPVAMIRARNEADGLHLNARTATPSWLGERLNLGWAISVLHPLARENHGNSP